MPGRGSFGHFHQKLEAKEKEESRYEEVDSGAYIDMGRRINGKEYYENFDFGENGIYQNILFKSKTTQSQNGIKRNKSLRIACRIEEKEDDEKSELNLETFDSRLNLSSSILRDWDVGGESVSKAKTLFTSSERRLVADFLRNMNTETSIS